MSHGGGITHIATGVILTSEERSLIDPGSAACLGDTGHVCITVSVKGHVPLNCARGLINLTLAQEPLL